MNKIFFGNLLPGTVLFNRFTLIRCLHSTDIGGVYLSSRKENPLDFVAIKVLSTKAKSDVDLSDGFLREVNLAYRVNHPNVVSSKEFYRDEDYTAFTMEYLGGGSLATLLEEGKPVSLEMAVDILVQLARGLKAIHEAKIIHRDIKPENILIAANGTVKIADFGISVSSGEIDPSIQEELSGTMNYLSPEYVEKGQVDIRSDIYAVGIIAYQLLTQKLPFQGKSLFDTLRLRVKFDPTPPHAIRKDVPRALSQIVLKAMARNPLARCQTIDELLRELEAGQKTGFETTDASGSWASLESASAPLPAS